MKTWSFPNILYNFVPIQAGFKFTMLCLGQFSI